jgi:Phage head-tail joining protein
MSQFPTYRQNKTERIGLLRDLVVVMTPVSTPTEHRGERILYAAWRSLKMNVAPLRGSEAVEADRLTNFNTKNFTVRAMSISGINEKSLLSYESEYYDIERIDDLPDYPHKAYKVITATRRDTTVGTVDFISLDGETPLYLAFSQTFLSTTANYVTITAGTILDTDDYTTAEINQLLYVFRGGLRLVYGDTGDNGYTIDNANNRITPVFSFAGETVLVHQFATI